jgi:DNA-binding NtrC family response regulator
VLTTHERLRPDDFPRQHLAFVAKHEGEAHELAQVAPRSQRAAPSTRVDEVEEKSPGSRCDTLPGNGKQEDLPNRLRTLEATMIRDVLQTVNWNRASAAERLGIPLRTLARKMGALGIEKPRRA